MCDAYPQRRSSSCIDESDAFLQQESTYRYLRSHFAEYAGEQPAHVHEVRQASGLFGIISADASRLAPLLRDIASLPSHIMPTVLVFSNSDTATEGIRVCCLARMQPRLYSMCFVLRSR